jgi:hypothetical protein
VPWLGCEIAKATGDKFAVSRCSARSALSQLQRPRRKKLGALQGETRSLTKSKVD